MLLRRPLLLTLSCGFLAKLFCSYLCVGLLSRQPRLHSCIYLLFLTPTSTVFLSIWYLQLSVLASMHLGERSQSSLGPDPDVTSALLAASFVSFSISFFRVKVRVRVRVRVGVEVRVGVGVGAGLPSDCCVPSHLLHGCRGHKHPSAQ